LDTQVTAKSDIQNVIYDITEVAAVLCGYEAWSASLKTAQKLRVLEQRVLSRSLVFGPNMGGTSRQFTCYETSHFFFLAKYHNSEAKKHAIRGIRSVRGGCKKCTQHFSQEIWGNDL